METFWKQITEFTSRMDQVIWGRPMLMLLLGTGIFLRAAWLYAVLTIWLDHEKDSRQAVQSQGKYQEGNP